MKKTLLLLLILLATATAARAAETVTAQPAVREATLTAFTRARWTMDIVPEEAGRCLEVTADIGDTIGEDGVFAQLDPTFLDLALRKNEHARDELKTSIGFYRKEIARYTRLVREDLSDQSNLDRLVTREGEARQQLNALVVEARDLKERRSRLTIRVPAGWTVTAREIEPGEWAAAGTKVGQAGDYRTLLVPFALSPQEYSILKKSGERLELNFPDEGVALPARIERVSPAFDPETRKISVDLLVAEGLPEMRGGLRAELTLSLPDPSGAVLVPRAALEERYEEYWLTRAGGEKVQVVYIGAGPGDTVRVRGEGIRPGDAFLAGE